MKIAIAQLASSPDKALNLKKACEAIQSRSRWCRPRPIAGNVYGFCSRR